MTLTGRLSIHPTLPVATLGSVSQHWIGTAAARVGVVEDRWLVYGKLSGGWVQSSAEDVPTGACSHSVVLG